MKAERTKGQATQLCKIVKIFSFFFISFSLSLNAPPDRRGGSSFRGWATEITIMLYFRSSPAFLLLLLPLSLFVASTICTFSHATSQPHRLLLLRLQGFIFYPVFSWRKFCFPFGNLKLDFLFCLFENFWVFFFFGWCRGVWRAWKWWDGSVGDEEVSCRSE